MKTTTGRNAFRKLCLWACMMGLVFKIHAGDFAPRISDARRQELVTEATQDSSADDLWAYIQKWHDALKAPAAPPTAQDKKLSDRARADKEATATDEKSIRMCAACRKFIHDFPSDPRSWEARRLILQDAPWERLSPKEKQELCELIVAAPEAPAALRTYARRELLIDKEQNLSDEEIEKAFSEYEKQEPEDNYGAQLVHDRLRHYAAKKQDPVPMLQSLVTSPNKFTAAAASTELDLRTKPLELQWTAINGKPVNFVKLRGKVVLLYFWATWGDPDRTILPQVMALKHNYAATDFKIIGICLDGNRADMRKTIKAGKMDWPNVNDSVEDKGSAIAWKFGNAQPQSAWLLDREGVAHQLYQGDDLDAEVGKRIETR